MLRPAALSAIAVAALLVGCVDPTVAHGPWLATTASSSDVAFVNDAFQTIYFVQQAEHYAALNGASPAVRAEAMRLSRRADADQARLAPLSEAAVIAPPAQLKAPLAGEIAELFSLHGTAFDRVFVADQLALLQQDLAAAAKNTTPSIAPSLAAERSAALGTAREDVAQLQLLSSDEGAGANL